MLASIWVTLVPQLRGASPYYARSPLRDQAYSGQSARCVRPALVHEHQAFRLDLAGHEYSPGGPQELVALRRSQRSFFRLHPRCLSIRDTVDSLTTSTPATRPKNSRLSGRVVPGASRGPPRGLVHLRFRAGAPVLGDQRAAFGSGGHVALDGRDAYYAEGAGDLGLRRAALGVLDDLLPQVFGVGVHAPMVPRGPDTLQGALVRPQVVPTSIHITACGITYSEEGYSAMSDPPTQQRSFCSLSPLPFSMKSAQCTSQAHKLSDVGFIFI